jgi:hypothetical protein
MSRSLHHPARITLASAIKLAGGIVLALACGMPMPVRAGVSIAGEPDAVRLEAREALLADVMAALRANFNLRYRTSAVLDEKVSGTYRGPLAKVASRLLDGYDFVMKVSAGTIEVSVLRRHAHGETPRPSQDPERRSVLPVPAAMSALEASQTERR